MLYEVITLDYKRKIVSFGNSLLDSTANRFGIVRVGGIYQLFQDDYLMQFDGNRPLSLYNFSQDSLLKVDVLDSEPEQATEMENLLKAIIQQYDDRVAFNKLSIDARGMEPSGPGKDQ